MREGKVVVVGVGQIRAYRREDRLYAHQHRLAAVLLDRRTRFMAIWA